MSIPAINWACRQTSVRGVTKYVLFILCNRADDHLFCFPSIRSIMADTGLGDTAVRQALATLCDEGLIRRERPRKADGSMGQYVYWILMDMDAESDPASPNNGGEKPSLKHGPSPNDGGGKSKQLLGPSRGDGGQKPSRKSNEVLDRRNTMVEAPPSPDDAGPPSRGDGPKKEPPLRLNHHKNKPMSEKAQTPVSDARITFEELWQTWPLIGRKRSKSKDQCFEAFNRACRKHRPAEILAAVQKFVRELSKPDYAGSLDKWFRDGKFEHFVAESPQQVLALEAPSLDWQLVLREWFLFNTWPRRAGPSPDQHDYRGPLEPVEALLPEFEPGHPVARDIRAMLAKRKRA